MVVGLTGAYASEWSLLSMYILFIAVVTFRARAAFGERRAFSMPEPVLAHKVALVAGGYGGIGEVAPRGHHG